MEDRNESKHNKPRAAEENQAQPFNEVLVRFIPMTEPATVPLLAQRQQPENTHREC